LATAWYSGGRHNGNQTDPSLGDCQPLACRNVALTEDNLSAWGDQLSKVDSALQVGDALAPYVHDRLRARRGQISRLLTTGEDAQE
jgi:hypothetical protein